MVAKRNKEAYAKKMEAEGKYWIPECQAYYTKEHIESKLKYHKLWVEAYEEVLKAGSGKKITHMRPMYRGKKKGK